MRLRKNVERFKNGLVVAVMFAAVSLMGIVISSRQAGAQGASTNANANANAGSAPVTIVQPIPLPVTGNVFVNTPAPQRYSVIIDSAPNAATPFPAVPAGNTFIVTYVTVLGYPLASQAILTDGVCGLELYPATPLGAIPLRLNDRRLVASEQMYLPFNAGEQLSIRCLGNVNAGFAVTVAGYFVPVSS